MKNLRTRTRGGRIRGAERLRTASSGAWRRPLAEPLEPRVLLAADVAPWQNTSAPVDVNVDGYVAPFDALMIINELNQHGSRSLQGQAMPRDARTFYDVSGDNFLSPLDALLVLNHLNAEGENGDLVRIRLATTDPSGNPIDVVNPGDDFLLRAFVQDLTGRSDGGVFAAYLDVTYQTRVSVTGAIVAGPSYSASGIEGNTSVPGLIDEAGVFDGLSPLGPGEFLLWTIPFQADSLGTVMFGPDPADLSPQHDTLVFGIPMGESSSIVPPDRIEFVGVELQIGQGASPIADDDGYDTDEDTPLMVAAQDGVLTNDTDPDGTTLAVTAVNGNAAAVGATITLPSGAQLLMNADGGFDYDPTTSSTFQALPEGGSANDAFTYRVTDEDGFTDTANVTVTVAGRNDLSVARDNVYSASPGAMVVGNVVTDNTGQGVDSDPDGDALQVAEVNGAAASVGAILNLASGASLQVNANGTFSYTSPAEFTGTDVFTYTVNDGLALSAPAMVTITVAREDVLVLFQLVVTNVFGTPITSISDGGTFFLEVYVQDLRPDLADADKGVFSAYADLLYSSSLVSPSGPVVFGPDYPNQQSGDTATPGLIDELGAFDGFTPLGGAPSLLATLPFTADVIGLASFFSEPADLAPDHDVLLFNQSLPVPLDRVEYGSASLTIVQGVAPVAEDEAYEVDEDLLLEVATPGVLDNDTDANQDPLAAVLATGPLHGTLTLGSDGSFTYLPDLNFHGVDSFTYRASDGVLVSDVATVTITVNPVPDAPVALEDAYEVAENGLLAVAAEDGVLANDSDGDGDELTAMLLTTTGNGTLTFRPDGSFDYQPNTGFFGFDTFTYVASDGELESGPATVTITVGDLTPSDLRGSVFTDLDDDGLRDENEMGIGGVEVHLTGADVLGAPVSLSTVTDADGRYGFASVLPGSYTLAEDQPEFLLDGRDSADGVLSLLNDQFAFQLRSSTVAQQYDFGELGLAPEFVGNPLFFASRNPNGILAALDSEGQTYWYCYNEGWEGYGAVEITLASNLATFRLTVVDPTGATLTTVMPTSGNRLFSFLGSESTGRVIRLNGTPEDFDLQPIDAMSAAAVDAVFAG